MTQNSAIEWTDHTFNPWTGCTKVGPGCDHCYAESWAKRSGVVGWGQGVPRRQTTPANWKKPLAWNARAAAEGKREKVFCASLADVFDHEVLQDWRESLWILIKATPNLDWIIVTKRISNAMAMLPADWGPNGYHNVWLLSTICNQEEADRDIGKLLAVPAPVHGLSMEPMLGAVDLTRLAVRPGRFLDALRCDFHDGQGEVIAWPPAGFSSLDWIICGGESGAKEKARPFDIEWPRKVLADCKGAGVAFFMKQMGRRPYRGRCDAAPNGGLVRLKDKKGGDPAEWPKDLRVRESPLVGGC